MLVLLLAVFVLVRVAAALSGFQRSLTVKYKGKHTFIILYIEVSCKVICLDHVFHKKKKNTPKKTYGDVP